MKTAILIGASGLVGKNCLTKILDSKDYKKIKVFVRSSLDFKHPNLIEHKVDFNRISDYKELFEGDDIFFCLGTTMKQAGSREAFKLVDYEYPLEIAKIGLEKKTKLFSIITAMGANPKSPVFYNKVKGLLEKELKNFGFPFLQIFRPSLLIGERDQKRTGEDFANKISPFIEPILQGPLKKFRPISGQAVGFAMAYTASHRLPGVHIYQSDKIQGIFDMYGK